MNFVHILLWSGVQLKLHLINSPSFVRDRSTLLVEWKRGFKVKMASCSRCTELDSNTYHDYIHIPHPLKNVVFYISLCSLLQLYVYIPIKHVRRVFIKVWTS